MLDYYHFSFCLVFGIRLSFSIRLPSFRLSSFTFVIIVWMSSLHLSAEKKQTSRERSKSTLKYCKLYEKALSMDALWKCRYTFPIFTFALLASSLQVWSCNINSPSSGRIIWIFFLIWSWIMILIMVWIMIIFLMKSITQPCLLSLFTHLFDFSTQW